MKAELCLTTAASVMRQASNVWQVPLRAFGWGEPPSLEGKKKLATQMGVALYAMVMQCDKAMAARPRVARVAKVGATLRQHCCRCLRMVGYP